MPCTHRWLLESPEEAANRVRKDGGRASVKATCKLCGARRDELTDKEIDKRLIGRMGRTFDPETRIILELPDMPPVRRDDSWEGD